MIKVSEEKRLLVFFGMIASGKSYLAEALARKWGCFYHNSDAVRKKMAGLAPECRRPDGYETGIYSSEFSRRTYDALISLAREDLDRESSACVILDASYQSAAERERLCREFDRKCRIIFVYCHCAEEILKQRMTKRLQDPHAVSDGRLEIYLEQKRRFELPNELLPEQLLSLDTDRPLAELLCAVERHLGMDRGRDGSG